MPNGHWLEKVPGSLEFAKGPKLANFSIGSGLTKGLLCLAINGLPFGEGHLKKGN